MREIALGFHRCETLEGEGYIRTLGPDELQVEMKLGDAVITAKLDRVVHPELVHGDRVRLTLFRPVDQ